MTSRRVEMFQLILIRLRVGGIRGIILFFQGGGGPFSCILLCEFHNFEFSGVGASRSPHGHI